MAGGHGPDMAGDGVGVEAKKCSNYTKHCLNKKSKKSKKVQQKTKKNGTGKGKNRKITIEESFEDEEIEDDVGHRTTYQQGEIDKDIGEDS
ncbi:hypothetical protein SESBI_19708 [Sesbania bispinosa]|nr:hypothetical protein SESBI_19708 [Sesbania bispinosa]